MALSSTELPPSLKTIVGAFQAVPDPMQRYKQLLYFATKLEPMPKEQHTAENKVKGCVSQVWVSPRYSKEDGRIYWTADSDSQLTKGLAALLVNGLSGCTPEEIVRVQPDFIAALGLQQSLTPSRNNGFLNMFKLMQAKALEIYMKEQQQQDSSSNGNDENGVTSTSDAHVGVGATSTDSPADTETVENDGELTNDSESTTPVADSIRRKLRAELSPKRLEIIDESHRHAGHAERMIGRNGAASGTGETHFMVDIVSEAFEGLSSLKRHRLVYNILQEEMAGPVHAMSLVTKTPSEAGM